MQEFFKQIKDFWNRDWLLKIISLVIAVLLWLYVGGEDVVDKNILVPVEVINLPENLIISNKYKKEIEVTVRGPRSLLLEMDKRQNPIQIDLNEVMPGTHVKDIGHDLIPVSRGVEVQRVQPSTIILSLDKLVEKQFAIHAVTEGSVPAGFFLKGIEITPDSISITGPQTVLSQLDSLKTVPIDIHGLTSSKKLQIPLQLDHAIVDLIGETSVTVDMRIDYDTIVRTLEKVPVQLSINGVIQQVKPATVSITVSIPEIASKKGVDLTTLVIATAEREGTGNTFRVKAVPQDFEGGPVTVVSIVPASVQLVERDPGKSPQASSDDSGDEQQVSGRSRGK